MTSADRPDPVRVVRHRGHRGRVAVLAWSVRSVSFSPWLSDLRQELAVCVRENRVDDPVEHFEALGYDCLEIAFVARLLLDELLGLSRDIDIRRLVNRSSLALEMNLGRRETNSKLRYSNFKAAFGSHTQQEWLAILLRYKHRCAYCGCRDSLEKDHRIPLCWGGSNLALNLQPLCKSCNSAKSGRVPPGAQFAIFDRVAESRIERRLRSGSWQKKRR